MPEPGHCSDASQGDDDENIHSITFYLTAVSVTGLGFNGRKANTATVDPAKKRGWGLQSLPRSSGLRLSGGSEGHSFIPP